jgi:hypothetical protein
MDTLVIKDKYSQTTYVLHGDDHTLCQKLLMVAPNVCSGGMSLSQMISALEELGRYDVKSNSDEKDNSEPLRLEIPMEWVYANEMEGRGE